MQKFFFLITAFFINYVFAANINIIAAENFYGNLAKEIGGSSVNVKSIISNPNADPHLFTMSTAISRDIYKAQVIIYNGNDYDGWIDQIIKLQPAKNAEIINVAHLMQLDKPKANPHIWYRPDTMPTLALHLANLFIKLDPANKEQYEHNLVKFLQQNQQVQNKVNSLKANYKGTWVTATEPVFNYMSDGIGLNMQGLDFQWKIMNNTEPSPKMLKNYLALLNNHKVRLVFYNNQVTDETTKNILAIAQKNQIPIVGVSETMPQNLSVNQWLMDELTETESALSMSK